MVATVALDRRVGVFSGLAGGCLEGVRVAARFLAGGVVAAFFGLCVADCLVGLGVASRFLTVEALFGRPGASDLVGLRVSAPRSGVGILAFRLGLGVCVVSLDLGFLRLGLGVADFLLGLGIASLLLTVEALLECLGASVLSGLGVLDSRLGLGVCVLSLVFGVLRLGLGVADFLKARSFDTLPRGLQHWCVSRLCADMGSSLAARAFRAFDAGSLAPPFKSLLPALALAGVTGGRSDGGAEPPLSSDRLVCSAVCDSLPSTVLLRLSRRL